MEGGETSDTYMNMKLIHYDHCYRNEHKLTHHIGRRHPLVIPTDKETIGWLVILHQVTHVTTGTASLSVTEVFPSLQVWKKSFLHGFSLPTLSQA